MNERHIEIVRAVNAAVNQAKLLSSTRASALDLAGEGVRGIMQGLTDDEADLALDTLAAFHGPAH